MINLLPPAHKRDLAAARTNTLLIRYNLLMLVAAGFMVGAIVVVYIFLQFTKSQAQTSININQSKAASYADVQKQAASFRSDLATAKQILAGQTNYAQMIINVAHTLPPGVILQQLSLDVATFGKPTTINAKAKSYGDILALKDNLQNSPLFSNVSIATISADGAGDYPFSTSFNITFNKVASK